jgi:hypothetical protein
MDWIPILLTPYTHHSELQVITALSLISTLYSSPQHPLSLFAVCCVFISRSLVTASSTGDSSASRTQILPPPTFIQNWLPATFSTELGCHLFSASLAELNCTRQVKVKVTLRLTVGQSVSQSWCRAPIWASWPDIYYCLTITVLLLWGALSDERADLSFVSVIVCISKSFVIMIAKPQLSSFYNLFARTE